ncbi:MAG: efflux RND transporter periplasmic adaptor subunit [Candidatus Acidiferrales bacterium]
MLSACAAKLNPDDPANAPRVAVVKVERRDIASDLEIASEFLPNQEIDVFAKVSGYIQKLDVDWGTHVKRGQVLAILEIPELEQQIDQDTAAVRGSEHDLARFREELSRNESMYSVAHITYSRIADVQKTQPGLVAQEEIDEAQGKDLQASANVSAAKDSLASAEQALAASRAALEKDKALYSYARITAPFDGVVTQINAYTGALLPAGTSTSNGGLGLCHLSQDNLLRLVIPVPERAVPEIHDGQKIDVDVSALKKTFRGQIVRLAGQIDVATRTMHTEVSVPNSNYELVPGMYASVRIPLHAAANVLTVPIQAVRPSGNGDGTVLVVNNANRVERRAVKLGLQSADYYEVVSGLSENEGIIFGEQNQYKDGELISPRDAGAAPAPQE